MLSFDIRQPPPTRQELEALQLLLEQRKKRFMRLALCSDLIHVLLFTVLYLGGPLSGKAMLITIGLAILEALMLATRGKGPPDRPALMRGILLSLTTVAVIPPLLTTLLHEPLWPALGAGLVAGSLVAVGGTLGRHFYQLLASLEMLKTFAEDEQARQELSLLCQQHPELEHYRQSACEILRPNLTIGELQAMRDWRRKTVE